MRRGITCAALVAAISATPGGLLAQTGGGVVLEWSLGEGAEQCIAKPELAARVEARLGRAIFATSPPADTTIAGSIERAPTAPRWRGTLRVTRANHASESREIVSDAPTCRPLSNAMALVLSLLVAPIVPAASPVEPGGQPPHDTNQPETPNPSQHLNPGQVQNANPGRVQNANPGALGGGTGRTAGPDLNPGRVGLGPDLDLPDPDLNPGRVGGGVRSTNPGGSRRVAGLGGVGGVNLGRAVRRPWGMGLAIGSVVQGGALPGVAYGPRVVGRVVAPLPIPVAVELQGVWLVGPEAVIAQGRADFTLLLAGVALCPELLSRGRFRVGACGGLDLGRVLVRGDFPEKSWTQRKLYGQVTAGGWISLRIHRWVSAGASAAAVVPLLRHDFEWEEWEGGPSHDLHRTGALAGQVEAHVGVEFP